MKARSQTGITLLEVMTVVGIILILTLAARSPISKYLKTMEQKSAVVGLRKLMQTARGRAMANPSLHCGVYFDTDSAPPKAFLFQDTFAPGSYAYDVGKDKPYLAPFALPKGILLFIPAPYPQSVIYRGDGSAFLSAKVVIVSADFSDTVDVLASTGRIRSTR
ncbi:MAG: hypothetical protein JWP91_2097 [Fibrobacteres bacterium]|nr:hypothetical protein [Fibrobacterota bacterium]